MIRRHRRCGVSQAWQRTAACKRTRMCIPVCTPGGPALTTQHTAAAAVGSRPAMDSSARALSYSLVASHQLVCQTEPRPSTSPHVRPDKNCGSNSKGPTWRAVMVGEPSEGGRACVCVCVCARVRALTAPFAALPTLQHLDRAALSSSPEMSVLLVELSYTRPLPHALNVGPATPSPFRSPHVALALCCA